MIRRTWPAVAALVLLLAGCGNDPTAADAKGACERSVATQVPTSPTPQFKGVTAELLDTKWVVKGTVVTVDTLGNPLNRSFTCLLRVAGNHLVPEGTEVD